MSYEEFRFKIIEILENFYGKDGVVEINEIVRNNGTKLYALWIFIKDEEPKLAPVIYLESVYEDYKQGHSIEDCVGKIIDFIRYNKCSEEVIDFTSQLSDWNLIENKVYPVLISNGEVIQGLVTREMLDMSIVYIVRFQINNQMVANVKVNSNMLLYYGITPEQLHERAMKNLIEDEYVFQDLENCILGLINGEEITDVKKLEMGKMYILKNRKEFYGAAGILHKDFLKEVIKDMNCFVLPSSINEMIFIPDNGCIKQSELDEMVETVNTEQVLREEQLQNHSYYYDGRLGEIRIRK